MLKTVSAVHVESDNDYATFERLVAARVAGAQGPLFTTNADGLFDAYLAGIPAEFRQHYTCHCCRRFVANYGGLVTIDESGKTAPALWGSWAELGIPAFFAPSVAAMSKIISRAKVTGVFVNGSAVWGNPRTGEWTHLSGSPATVFKSPLKTASQAAAEKTQDYITLHRGLAEIPLEAVVQAVRVLEADAVDRSEKTLGIAKWLLALQQSIAGLKGPTRDNLIWRAVATAPPGWCHIRSTMIATLLDDVIQGLPFESIARRWAEKMHPLQYQRPTAPPKAGNIEQANKIVAQLQSEGALARRFARLSEVTALWKPNEVPAETQKPGGGAFDHLKAQASVKEVELPAKALLWETFRDTVLPSALKIEVNAPSHGGYFGLVTAENADAPPILQWDGLEGWPRNPVSWYFYHGGSRADQWGIAPGWHEVAAVCLKPCYWQEPGKFVHQGPGVFFLIAAMRESREAHAGFFPECLRAEYHGIRSVMEAHARQAIVSGKEEGNANGIALGDNETLTVRVKTAAGIASYALRLSA